MPSATRNWPRILAPLLLVTQALLVQWAASGQRQPAPPDLERFPAQIGHWKLLGEDPIAADVKEALGADRLLSRLYIHDQTRSSAALFVAWFQSQVWGNRQPHSPKVCLPGAGWTAEMSDEVSLRTASGALRVNRYMVVNRGERAIVLYWYQTPRRVVAGEWAAKFWVVADALRDRRTDTALVRLVVWTAGGKPDAATADALEFGQELYPVLRQHLPAISTRPR